MHVSLETELAHRKTWALARIATLVNIGRSEGWLTGSAIVVPDVSAPALSEASASLVELLDLESCELDALWLLACVELDPMVACAAAQLFVLQATAITTQILEHLIQCGGASLDHRALSRLAQLGLVEIVHAPYTPLFRRTVRASDRLLALLRGDWSLDPELEDIARLDTSEDVFADAAPAPQIGDVCAALKTSSNVFIVAYGSAGMGRSTVLRQAYAMRGGRTLQLEATGLSKDEHVRVRQLRAFVRECLLHSAAPLVRNIDGAPRDTPLEQEVLRHYQGPVFATAHEPCELGKKLPTVFIEVRLPDSTRSALHWRAALPGAPESVIRSSSDQFTVSPAIIKAAAATVLSHHTDRSKISCADIGLALRAQLDRKLAGLATRIETRQTWRDLVLPVDQFDTLIELVSRIRHRTHVLDTWGFADKVGRGTGVSALFSGPPGTGKTMIAGLLAHELGLDLYQVDLSRVVSKYIGETEKQLAAVFEAAESGHAIILFDEADSLFGKRTEVKSSNDRYANLEVNYLLQRMEAFRGITLMTTNHETAIDQAFQRRLAFHVRVPMPDEPHRALLWRSMLPERARVADDLDIEGLAREFSMTGGYIKNAALRAAFLAADAGTAITNEHLWRAARAEYDAMGKISYQAAS